MKPYDMATGDEYCELLMTDYLGHYYCNAVFYHKGDCGCTKSDQRGCPNYRAWQEEQRSGY